jgi:non-reducing end alpha-L-arabinofuranosidase
MQRISGRGTGRAVTLGLALAALVLLLVAATAPRAAAASATAPGGGLPCDLDAAGGTPCVAAYSTVRLLDSTYTGPLYQVTRASDGATRDIGFDPTSGIARATAQERFCQWSTCTITELFDQSGHANNLTVATGPAGTPDLNASATALPVRVGGQLAYGLDVTPGVGYRDDQATGLALGSGAQSVYMVTSAQGTDSGCCFDFGNAETGVRDDGDAHMDAVNVSSWCVRPQPCQGPGPWVQADLEDGLFQSNRGDSENPYNPSLTEPFVTAMVANDGTDWFAVMDGDAQEGPLVTSYAGILPDVPFSDYVPMQQEGGVTLGVGGDNSRLGSGEFFEGVVTAGLPLATTDVAVQANIVAAGYESSPPPPPLPLPPFVADAPRRMAALLTTARFWSPRRSAPPVLTSTGS